MAHFLYVRKSEEDDGRQVQSIGDQLKLGYELADASGITISEVFQEAKSAKRPGRPVFSAMVARIEAGEAQGLIAWHPDRLARNAVDAGMLIDLIDRGRLSDLKFHSYRFENTPEGKWMLSIVLGQSKYFVDKLSKDVKRGMRSKLEKGHYPQLAPPGYLNDPVSRSVIADPQRFELVQRAVRLVLHRTYSAPQALRMLNEDWGFRTIQRAKTGGKPLSRSAFYRLLISPFPTGLMQHGGELFQGQHPPMLDQREWEELQQILGRGKVNVRQKREFEFSGLLKCGLCGCQVTAEAKTKYYKGTGRTKTYIYYHCTNGKGGCSKQSITQEAVQAQVIALLERATLQSDVAQWCLEPARRWHYDESGLNHEAIESLSKALHSAERKKSNLLDAHLSDAMLFSSEEFKEQKERLQSEINRLRRDIKKAEEELEHVRRTVENVFDFAVNARSRFASGNTQMRREIAAQLGISYYLTLGKLEIEPHPLLVPILAFEPPDIGSGNRKDGGDDALRLSWLTLRDDIRTSAIAHQIGFPRLNLKSATTR
jgi:DNA invertase Pin-like site-specific DNA recombinase